MHTFPLPFMSFLAKGGIVEWIVLCHSRMALLRGSVLPLSSRGLTGVVAWLDFTTVIPWLDHGIQLKILKLLVFVIVFMDLVSKRTR